MQPAMRLRLPGWGRIHDAKYVEACKLVYVRNKAFGFVTEA
jgi:hypothetical protein